MSFWSMSDGSKATGIVPESNDFVPLPKAQYLTMLESMTIDEYQGAKKIKGKARIIGDGPYKNRVVFFNVKCWDEDPKAHDRAVNLLKKMHDVMGVAMPEYEPDDEHLSKLQDKPLMMSLEIWRIFEKDAAGNDTDVVKNEGNWVRDVAPKGAKAGGAVKVAPKAAAKLAREPGMDEDEGQDVPF